MHFSSFWEFSLLRQASHFVAIVEIETWMLYTKIILGTSHIDLKYTNLVSKICCFTIMKNQNMTKFRYILKEENFYASLA